MRPNYRMLSAALVFSIFAAPVFADQKHGHKKHAKDGKHAVERTYLFHEMDDNHDGVISRREWRGNSVSFRQHDWNRNGVLSGEELRRGAEPAAVHTAARQAPPARTTSIRTERDEVLFARRDHNHDGRITRDEWGDTSAFNRLDKNHDNVISAYEYGVGR
jgi:Ca2+-binding EF-hand superfamily protein